MKTLISVILVGAAGPALAHPTHVTEASGHTHWFAAAVAVVVVVAIVALWQSKKETASQEA